MKRAGAVAGRPPGESFTPSRAGRQRLGGFRRLGAERLDDERPEEERADDLREEDLDDERADELRDEREDRLEAAGGREPLERDDRARGGGEEDRERLDCGVARGCSRGGGAERVRGSTRRGSLRRGSTRCSVDGALRASGRTRSPRSDGLTDRKGVEPGVFERTPSITRRGME